MRIVLSVVFLLFVVQINSAQNKESVYLNNMIDYVACTCINDALAVQLRVNCEDKEQVNSFVIPENDKQTLALYKDFQWLRKEEIGKDTLKFFVEGIFNNEQKYSAIYDFAQKRKGDKIANLKATIALYMKHIAAHQNAAEVESEHVNLVITNSENIVIQHLSSKPKFDDDEETGFDTLTENSNYTFWLYGLIAVNVIFGIVLISLFQQKSKLKAIVNKMREKVKRQN
ncbi:hypothetical protein [Flavobacterium sp. SM2513]|uniref:hypothetical protein n=1 Tax=Flavobacterium sp. SM2513 TaxID=3424766 RepID=UPI003D7FF5B0